MLARLHHELQCPKCGSDEVTRSHRTRRERFVLFLTASLPYRCSNCRHRFYIKDRRQLTELYALWGVLLLAVIGAMVYFSYRDRPGALPVTAGAYPGQDSTQSGKEGAVKPVSPGEPQDTLSSRPAPKESEPPAPVIRFSSYDKYGVKWDETEEGLRITRLKQGPLKEAGLGKGDVIVAINGDKATDMGMLKIRDDIISGTLTKAIVIVKRDKEQLVYELKK